jgi:hypothetical protein
MATNWPPNSSLIPPITKECIEGYVTYGLPPGHFLYAVLTNNLRDAIGAADERNGPALPHIVA